MTPVSRFFRPLHGALVCSLVAGALALPSPARADFNVVDCTPAPGAAPIVKLAPAAVIPPKVAKLGVKIKTTTDGCVANTAKLNEWVPSKNGTADGPIIAAADLAVSLSGYGSCSFGLLKALGQSEPAGEYDPVGTMKLTWLDVNGKKIKGAKPSSAFVHMIPFNLSGGIGSQAVVAEGVVTKGLGIGATIRMSIPITLPTGPGSNPWILCALGGGPPTTEFPMGVPAVPLKEFPVSGRPRVTIAMPDVF